jgi:hypothetical protein
LAADLGLGTSLNDPNLFSDGISLTLNDDGYYWFLYRYFESANLDKQHELIDLYGDAEIDGYQLERLEEELRQAHFDANNRNDSWDVLTSWHGSEVSKQAEIRKVVEKNKMIELIQRLLDLIEQAKRRKLKLICVGD